MEDRAPRILGGSLKGRPFAVPKGKGTRPLRALARRSLFDILGPSLVGARALDLYAGAGTVGIEAISRGATHVTLVEKGRPALSALQQTVARFGIEASVQISPVSVLDFVLQCEDASFDFIYLGPPYPLLREGDPDLRDALEEVGRLLAPDGTLVLETPADFLHLAVPPLEHDQQRSYGDTRLDFFSPASCATQE